MVHGRITKSEVAVKKAQILAAYYADGDWRSLAEELGIKTSTSYKWVKEGAKADARGGLRSQKILDEHKSFMVEKIENNPRLTLKEMTELIFEKFNLVVSKECIRKHFDAMLYTLKEIRFEPEVANTPENREKRKLYATSLLNYQARNIPILFMDETNFNIHISRGEGRSIRGTRCSTIAAGSKGANVHVIGCISNHGLVHHEVRRGSFKKEDACLWIKQCLRKARDIYQGPCVLVIDNAPCHSAIEEILRENEFSMHFILRLGPYSPMLNPIENIWSFVKANVKRVLAIEMGEILNRENMGNLTIKEFRFRKLDMAIRNALLEVTPEKCVSVIARLQGLLPDAIGLRNMTF